MNSALRYLFVWLAFTVGAYAQLSYEIYEGKVTITKYVGSPDTFTIPSTIAGLPVVGIGGAAFKNNTALKSVTIPVGVKTIGSAAFMGCTGLTSITIPDGVTNIEPLAFLSCSGLKTVTIPDSAVFIGDSAFGNCSGLTSIKLPPNLADTGFDMLSGCSGLTSITIPANVTWIDETAFLACESLQSIVIPAGVTRIGYEAFANCKSLKSIYVMGDAPSVIPDYNFFFGAYSGLTVYYLSGKTGFSSTPWSGVKTVQKDSFPLVQTITFSSLPDIAYTTTPITLSASASSSLPVTFTVVDGPASVSGNTLKIKGGGVVTVRASQAGNAGYFTAQACDISFVVSKFITNKQRINFDALAPRVLGFAPFILVGSASSGLPVSFEIVSGVATLNADNLLTVTGAGTVVIRATQSGNGVYSSAPPVLRSMKVAKVTQHILLMTCPVSAPLDQSPLPITFISDYGLSVSIEVVSGPAKLGLDGKTVIPIGVGTVKVRFTQAGNANIAAAPSIVRTIKITPSVVLRDVAPSMRKAVSRSYAPILMTTTSVEETNLLNEDLAVVLLGAADSLSQGIPVGSLDLRMIASTGRYIAIVSLADESAPLFISGTVEVLGTADKPIITGDWSDTAGGNFYSLKFILSNDTLIVSVSKEGLTIAEADERD